MSEYTERRWRCDYCARNVKRGIMPPKGWREIRLDMYGNVVHCCDCVGCEIKLREFLQNNYPSALEQVA